MHKSLLLLTFSLFLLGTGKAAVAVGSPAPGFTLNDLAGKPVQLSDYAGKIVVLEWTNVDCPFVKKHYASGNIPVLQEKYTAQGVVWLSVCSSAPGKEGNHPTQEIEATRAAWHAASTDYLVDADGIIGRLYGAKTTPHFFIVDKQGVVRYTGGIDSIASANPDDIRKAEPYVAKALDALLAGKPVATPVTTPYGCSVKYGALVPVP
ncbi:MAG: thioredoxin family protein [Verrucomicrobium sp.]|nr:thioredoxin family protein [Verrucomicrobium sp.]